MARTYKAAAWTNIVNFHKAFSCTLSTILLSVFVAGGCERPGVRMMEIAGPTMGTYYSVKIAGRPADMDLETLKSGIETTLDDVIALISTYDENSELSRLNANQSNDWIPISPELLGLLETAVETSEASDGAFDVTVGPLVNLWGFGPETKPEQVPSADEIAATLARVGYDKLELQASPPAIRKARGDMYIDLSALGEGYGADRLAAYLDTQGVDHYLVAVAGALHAKGRNLKGTPWAVAIEEPSPGRRTVYSIMHVSGRGLSTSGDYRNFFEQGGRRYSHAIDPKTGEPIRHSLASVTVVDATAERADGLATALLVMGDERAPRHAEAQGIAAFFIVREDDGFSEHATSAFGEYLAQ